MTTERIETERLILRPWQIDDAENLYELAKDPEVGPATGWPAHTSVGESRMIIENILIGPHSFAIVSKYTGELMGSIGLHKSTQTDNEKNDNMEIGYWIGHPFWGHSYMPEAVDAILEYVFLKLKLDEIWCAYFDGNTKSKRVQEKCGFKYHHTEYNKTNNKLGESKTVHFTHLSKKDWIKLND